MSLLSLITVLGLAGSPPALLAGNPSVTWKAPSAFVAGTPFLVEVELTVPEGGAAVAQWMLSATAFSVNGTDVPGERGPGTLELPAGTQLSAKVDLSKSIEGTGGTGDFELAYAKDLSKQAPVKVRRIEVVPAGLDFTKMPVEELKNYQVLLLTTSGEMRLEMWPDVAPEHVRNFLDLSYTGFYDGTKFHRVMKGFMIQGGDPNTKSGDPATWGQGNGPRKLKAEFNDKKHDRGVLSAARGPDVNSASCQFFICHAAAAHLDKNYSAFGKLIDGYEALDKIANTPGAPIPGGAGGTRPNPAQVLERALVVKAAPVPEKKP